MGRRLAVAVAVVILFICLLAGGCSTFVGDDSLKAWKDLLSLAPEDEAVEAIGPSLEDLLQENDDKVVQQDDEYIIVPMYYANADKTALVSEERQVLKKEGIARETINELLQGPQTSDYVNIFPEGTRLLDINVKPDGLCIVDLSSEARNIKSEMEEKLLVYSIANTLGEFPTVSRVSFMINGQKDNYIAGYVEWAEAIEPNYKF